MEHEEDFDYQTKLEEHHLDIVKCLDLDRQYILSHLRSKFVLDDEDCQLIQSGASSRQKAAKFIDILMTKGPKGFTYFVEALEIEHPHLYEVMTGNKATYKIDSLLPDNISPWCAFSREELAEFEKTYLLKELKEAKEYNRDSINLQERFIEERKLIEEKLQIALKEIQDQENLIKELKQELESNNTKHENHEKPDTVHTRALQQEQENVASRTIINLQSKLLATREYFERLRKTNEALRRKNESLVEQVRDLTINYDFQRTQSKHLSKQVNKNNSDRKQVDEAKREMMTLRFDLSKMKEDKEELLLKVDELTNQNLEFESLCDILRKEKSSDEVNKGKVSVSLTGLESKIKQLQILLHDEQLKKDIYKNRSVRLREDIEALKEQRDNCIQEREQAFEERNQITSELDVCLRLKQDMQVSRDEAVRKQIKMEGAFEKKNSALQKEIESLLEKIDVIRTRRLTAESTRSVISKIPLGRTPGTIIPPQPDDHTHAHVHFSENTLEFESDDRLEFAAERLNIRDDRLDFGVGYNKFKIGDNKKEFGYEAKVLGDTTTKYTEKLEPSTNIDLSETKDSTDKNELSPMRQRLYAMSKSISLSPRGHRRKLTLLQMAKSQSLDYSRRNSAPAILSLEMFEL